MTVTKLEDSENHRNAFEISGDRRGLCGCPLSRCRGSGPHARAPLSPRGLHGRAVGPPWGARVCALTPSSPCLSPPGSMIERILVSCNNQQDLHEWVDRLQKQTKAASAGNPSSKPHSVPSHTVRAPPRPAPAHRPRARRAPLGLGPLCRRVLIPRGPRSPHRDPLVSQACLSASREFTHTHAHGSPVRRPSAPA